ncbi:MAG: signal peptide peptidase SppA [Bacteroidales bacterium]|nr:signal peptide peptidase SppA [Bacteroidales bacterium]
MKSFLKYVLASMVGFFLIGIVLFFLFVGVIASIASFSEKEPPKVEANSVLFLDFNQPIVDKKIDNPFANFSFSDPEGSLKNQPIQFFDFIRHIHKAKEDANIKGIYIELKNLKVGLANLEEIRAALKDFKTSGKFIIIHGDVYSQLGYYLATVADKIYLTPEGDVNFYGLNGQGMFFKGLLDKLNVEPIVIRHGKFKSAVEPFILDKMSESNYLQTKTYVSSIWGNILSEISNARHISVDSLNSLADAFAVNGAENALKYNFVDGLKYYDEVIAELKDSLSLEPQDDLTEISMSDYVKLPLDITITKDKIAIVYASGEIGMGKGDDESIGSESLSKQIRKARQDSSVKAVVLRVNSPGGSALASEIIWREVILTKKVKPVIVSMGDVAASGGYYISSPADYIVADKTTITGSIGVFGLLWNAQKFFNDKLGITFDGYKTNEHADMGSTYRPMTATEKALMQNMVEKTYHTFLSHVADGRGMTIADVDSIGQGRVWTGDNAKGIKLVDEYGGLERALEIAAEKAGLEKYRIMELPKAANFWESLLDIETTKTKILDNYTDNLYSQFKEMKELTQKQGVMALMPFTIKFE